MKKPLRSLLAGTIGSSQKASKTHQQSMRLAITIILGIRFNQSMASG